MRFPGEWEPHERTIMGWPCRLELWGETIELARAHYAAVANAVAAFEPVTMIANAGADAEMAQAACGAGVSIVELPLDDSWLRDSGPIYVVDDGTGQQRPGGGPSGDARRVAVHFGFNAWGGKFPPWDRDAEIGGLIARELGDEVRSAREFVLEGGSVLADGAGTILTTEQCLLNPNRNPTLSREAIEAKLADYLGAERVLWLGQGLVEDRDTDGHVDLIAAYVDRDHVLLQTVPEGNPNYENCQENRRRLEAAGVSVIEVPVLPYVEVVGEEIAASYLNLYICNGGVVVPVADVPEDEQALEIIRTAFPDREVVAVPGPVLAYGGGGPHCITQQVPAI